MAAVTAGVTAMLSVLSRRVEKKKNPPLTLCLPIALGMQGEGRRRVVCTLAVVGSADNLGARRELSAVQGGGINGAVPWTSGCVKLRGVKEIGMRESGLTVISSSMLLISRKRQTPFYRVSCQNHV